MWAYVDGNMTYLSWRVETGEWVKFQFKSSYERRFAAMERKTIKLAGNFSGAQ